MQKYFDLAKRLYLFIIKLQYQTLELHKYINPFELQIIVASSEEKVVHFSQTSASYSSNSTQKT
jgi:hypothetical protein